MKKLLCLLHEDEAPVLLDGLAADLADLVWSVFVHDSIYGLNLDTAIINMLAKYEIRFIETERI